MIQIENTLVFGWEAAIRGMRNPMNSWSKSDSFEFPPDEDGTPWIGKADLDLMRRLVRAGSDHAKFLRMINVTADITAPLYWFKEYDTYKVGTVANSCSTMHKIASKEFTLDDFSHEHLDGAKVCTEYGAEQFSSWDVLNLTVKALNHYRDRFNETGDKNDWWQMIQLLPSTYNQRRTVQLNYQVLQKMYFARRTHKLDEWHDFCAWCEPLPYFSQVIIQEGMEP